MTRCSESTFGAFFHLVVLGNCFQLWGQRRRLDLPSTLETSTDVPVVDRFGTSFKQAIGTYLPVFGLPQHCQKLCYTLVADAQLANLTLLVELTPLPALSSDPPGAAMNMSTPA